MSRFIRAISLLALIFAVWSPGQSQAFKRLLRPDTVTFQNPFLMVSSSIIETGIPGRELAISGTVNANDTSNTSHQAVFNLQISRTGNPVRYDFFEDQSVFLWAGPRLYGSCYDGYGHFYHAIASNNKPVLLRTRTDSSLVWAFAGNHHEYFGLTCDGASVMILGQTESIQGGHDFSLSRIDSAGNPQSGMMYGTPEFDLPEKMIRVGNQLVLAGSSFQGTYFHLLVAKADLQTDQIWGKAWTIPDKNLYIKDLAPANEGDGYVVFGRASGGSDSLIIVKLDTAGNPVWTKLIGLAGATEMYGYGIAADPGSGGYLLCGAYRGPQYLRPFVLRITSSGVPAWGHDYGDPGPENDGILNDVIRSSSEDFFYAVGDLVSVNGTNYTRSTLLVKALASDGLTGCDSALSFGSVSALIFPGPFTNTEPHLTHVSHPFGSMSGQVLVTERCSLQVGSFQSTNEEVFFSFVNPASQVLDIVANMPAGGGTVEVHALTGQLMFRLELGEGPQRSRTEIGQLSSGLYLVRITGDGWRSETKRLVIQR